MEQNFLQSQQLQDWKRQSIIDIHQSIIQHQNQRKEMDKLLELQFQKSQNIDQEVEFQNSSAQVMMKLIDNSYSKNKEQLEDKQKQDSDLKVQEQLQYIKQILNQGKLNRAFLRIHKFISQEQEEISVYMKCKLYRYYIGIGLKKYLSVIKHDKINQKFEQIVKLIMRLLITFEKWSNLVIELNDKFYTQQYIYYILKLLQNICFSKYLKKFYEMQLHIFFKVENLIKQITLEDKSLEDYPQLSNMLCQIFMQIGSIYINFGQFEISLGYYKKAMKFIRIEFDRRFLIFEENLYRQKIIEINPDDKLYKILIESVQLCMVLVMSMAYCYHYLGKIPKILESLQLVDFFAQNFLNKKNELAAQILSKISLFENRYKHICQANSDIELILKKVLPNLYEKKQMNNSYYDNIMYDRFKYDELQQVKFLLVKNKQDFDNNNNKSNLISPQIQQRNSSYSHKKINKRSSSEQPTTTIIDQSTLDSTKQTHQRNSLSISKISFASKRFQNNKNISII